MKFKNLLLTLSIVCFVFQAQSQICYSEDFEGITKNVDPNDDAEGFAGTGWLGATNGLNNPGLGFAFTAGSIDPIPNGGPAYSSILCNVAPVDSDGPNFLNVYNNYDPGIQTIPGIFSEANVFQQFTITAADVGTYEFCFDYRLAEAPFTPDVSDPDFGKLNAFIREFGPGFGFFVGEISFDVGATGTTGWQNACITFSITAAQVGNIIQFGFNSAVTNFANSGVYYDNVLFQPQGQTDGTECDDLDPTTANDVFTDCVCAGTIIPVPTLGQWGLTILCLSLMALGIGVVYQRKIRLA